MNVIWFEIEHIMSDMRFKTVRMQCNDETQAVAKFRSFSDSIAACPDSTGGLVINCEDTWKRFPASFLNECIITLQMGTVNDSDE